MSEITNHWLSDECRTEDGIYFSDDTFVPLMARLPELPRRSVAELLKLEPDSWSSVYIGEPLAKCSGYVVLGGETSCEGAGFLALVREADESLVWLLSASDSEGFRSASILGQTITAKSQEYPIAWQWKIPLYSPWALTVVCSDT
jgi:hypothetical protein